MITTFEVIRSDHHVEPNSLKKHGHSLYIEVLLLERVENIVAKGEIALLSQCFLNSSAAEA